MEAGAHLISQPLVEGLVSVVVPTFNRAGLVRRCYDSVVAQGHRPLEFLLADDASTDDTATAAAALPPAAGVSVRYLRQPENKGVSAARNLALQSARGELIAMLDSDDVWFPDHLSRLLRLMRQGDCDVAYARGDIRESPEAPASGRSSFGPTAHEEAHAWECLYYYNFVLPSVTLVRRGFFEKAGLFDETAAIQHAEDWDIALRAAALRMKFCHIAEPTAYYTTPAVAPEAKKQMMMRRFIYCLDKHRNHAGTPLHRRHLTRGYYRVWLGLMLGVTGAEPRALFSQALKLSCAAPVLALPALCGLMLPRLPERAHPFGRRVFSRLFRRVRAAHRTLRGFPDPWD